MNKYINPILFRILGIFLIWRILLIIFLIFAVSAVPLANIDRFLGGGAKNYQLAPEFFSWANFDGEHYLAIAIFGYKELEQAFFPVYPILVNFFSKPFHGDQFTTLVSSTMVGLLISNIAFFLAMVFLWKLIRIDFSEGIAYLTLVVLVLFPASFYFGSLYNESFFLLLSVVAFYNARRGNWLVAGILGGVSSATRIFGLLLFFAFLIEAYQQKISLSKIIWIFLVPLGLVFYMIYQYTAFGDPLAFYHLQKIVGEQRQSGLTLLPQVYFRYIKMLLTVDIQNPIYQTIVLEFIVGVLFFLLPIYGYFKKIRLSYLFYAMAGFLLPTIQGSFSSVPRYVLVFFPSFLALALFLNSRQKILKGIFVAVSTLILAVETVLFLRGYWIA